MASRQSGSGAGSTSRSRAATAAASERLAERHGTHLVALSGGVFANRLLIERAGALLREAGLEVLLAAELPPNDGAISYGQVAVAAARLRDERVGPPGA